MKNLRLNLLIYFGPIETRPTDSKGLLYPCTPMVVHQPKPLDSPVVMERCLCIQNKLGMASAGGVLGCWITLLKVLHTCTSVHSMLRRGKQFRWSRLYVHTTLNHPVRRTVQDKERDSILNCANMLDGVCVGFRTYGLVFDASHLFVAFNSTMHAVTNLSTLDRRTLM